MNSMRKQRHQWRYILGLSVLGLLVIASASYAGGEPDPLPVSQNHAQTPAQVQAQGQAGR